MSTPQYIGPYEVVRPLGMGGMAETFEGLRRGPAGFEQRVCIKRVLPVFASEARFVDMFLDEARLLAQLRNARITQVYDFGEADGTYYLALELVDGTDLEGLMRTLVREGRPFPVDVLTYVLAELLSALSYAHSLTVHGQPLALVHRDISPSNVLASSHGEVKLTDFGIAKSRQRAHRTKTGHTRGKLAYMSPEQLRGEDVDGRSDLFAVGVVAYELLSGRHPFDADTDLGLIQNIVSGTRIPLGQLVADAPPRLVALIDDLLQIDREQRPATAEQALAILPFEQASHVAQRALSTLVRAHQESAALSASRGVRPMAPRVGGEPSAQRTPFTPPAVHPSRTDALSGARGPVRQPSRMRVVGAVVGGLAVAALGLVLTQVRREVTPAPTPPDLSRPEAPAAVVPRPTAAPDAARVTGAERVTSPERAEPASPATRLPSAVDAGLPAPSAVAEGASPAAPGEGAPGAGSAAAPQARAAAPVRPAAGRRRTPAQPTAAPPTAPAAAEPSAPAAEGPRPRSRSGLSVRPDDF